MSLRRSRKSTADVRKGQNTTTVTQSPTQTVCVCLGRGVQLRGHTYLSRCSTPTSSASSAPISLVTCSNVLEVGVPSWENRTISVACKQQSFLYSHLHTNVGVTFKKLVPNWPKGWRGKVGVWTTGLEGWSWGSSTYIMYLLHREVGLGRQAQVLGLHIDDDQHLTGQEGQHHVSWNHLDGPD